jgi:hypothetical protein
MKEAREALQELERRTQTAVAKRSLKAPARVFVEAIKSRAKVSDRARDPTRGSLRSSVKLGKSSSRKGSARQEVLVDDIAAVAKEYGLTHRHYPAEPFARPAIDGARDEAGAALAEELKQQIDAAALAAAAKGKKA